MGSRKIHVVPSNGSRRQQLYRSQPDIWTKLRGKDDFTNLDSTKIWELVTVSVSEFLGTAILVGVGCSSMVTGMDATDGHVSHTVITLTFAFAICLVVTLFAHISGCHVNPAVSLSSMILGYLSLPRFLIYVISQCLGAIAGAAAIRGLSPEGCAEGAFCVTQPHIQVGDVKGMMIEAAMTGILVGVCAAVWDRRCQDKHDSLPVKFGLVIAALVFPGAKFTGASLNPARSLGPVVMSGHWAHHWVYWAGPCGGSIIASAIYRVFFTEVHTADEVPTQPPRPEELPL